MAISIFELAISIFEFALFIVRTKEAFNELLKLISLKWEGWIKPGKPVTNEYQWNGEDE